MSMSIEAAQREVRNTYVGGFPGQFISSLVWFLSAILAAWVSWSAARWALIIGGVFIFLLLEGAVRLNGRKPSLSPENPLNPLAMQVAFTLPLMLPLIVAAFMAQPDWLYPAFMVGLGVHYLPFMFLFGMWQFGGLSFVLVGSGIVFGFAGANHFAVAGWYGAAVQLVFAFICFSAYRHERNFGGSAP